MEYIVRRFVQEDVPQLVELVLREVPKLPNYAGLDLAADRILFLLSNNTRDESSFMIRVLCNENGAIVGGVGAYCVTSLLSWDKVTNDIFLYVEPHARSLPNVVKLILSYKQWAKERGAKLICATQTGGYKQEEIDALLRRYGKFKPVGTIYHARD